MSASQRRNASQSTPVKSTVDANASFEDLIDIIIEGQKSMLDAVNAGKSVTTDGKNVIRRNAQASTEAAMLLKKRRGEPIPSTPDAITLLIKEEFAKIDSKIDAKIQAATPLHTYASVAASKPNTNIKTPTTRPSIIVESNDASIKSGKDVINAFRSGVSFKNANYAPTKVRLVSNNKIRVEFNSDAERLDALKRLESAKGLKCENARRRLPMVIIKGVSNNCTPEELAGVINSQNPTVNNASTNGVFKLRFTRRNRRDALYNAVFEVSGNVRLAMLNIGRLNVDHQRLHVEEYAPFTQCYNCLQFGHTSKQCNAEHDACSHCGVDGHGFNACPNKSDVSKRQCYNCIAHNKQYNRNAHTDHSATSFKDCPRIKNAVKRLANRVDYGVSN